MNNEIKRAQPFDSFVPICKILVAAGYYEYSVLNKSRPQLKKTLFQIYRLVALLIVVIYNVQHLIYTMQHWYNLDELTDCLVITIPQINLFSKCSNMLVRKSRINKIQRVLTGPIFSASHDQDQLILKQNSLEMNRLNRVLLLGVSFVAFLWPGSLFVKRLSDETATVYSYMPFETDSWSMFALSVFLETGFALWTGHGHIALDHLIAAYYAHAQAQLKIVSNQLERLCANVEGYENVVQGDQYLDLVDDTVNKRFIKIVERFKTVVWYKNELDDVFNFPMTVQFLSTIGAVCVAIYRMTLEKVASFQFTFLALLCLLFLFQVFAYCYYGNLVEFESRLINDKAYNSDWLSLSPKFRRMLLIAMSRWSQPIQPRVCGIVTLSLNTFVQILKSSYTLYTVLVITAKPEQ